MFNDSISDMSAPVIRPPKLGRFIPN